METETMIRELKHTANKHMYDTLRTFDTNITALCNDVIPKLEELKKYEDTSLTPEVIMEWSLLTVWIPVAERLPKIGADVLLSLRSLDVFIGFRSDMDRFFYVKGEGYIEYGNVSAWMPLPEPYKE